MRLLGTRLEQGRQPITLSKTKGFALPNEVAEFRAKDIRCRDRCLNPPLQLIKTKSRKSRITAQEQGVGHIDFRTKKLQRL